MSQNKESQSKTEHAFNECGNCGGKLEYQTRADVLCSDCGAGYHHEIRAPARHLLWSFDDDYRLDEIVEEVVLNVI